MSIFVHQEQEISTELWRYFKKHYNDTSEADQNRAFEEFNAICVKHKEDPFCNEMAEAMVKQLMRKWSEDHGKVS